MLRTRMIRGVLGAAALAAWLAGVASAQNYHVVAYDDGGNTEATALKADVAELREQLGNTTQVGYEASCGCSAHVAPGCGCTAQVATGCAGGCGGCDMGCDCGCCEPCCHSSGLYAIGEAMFFRYHRADGVREGALANEVNEFDFEVTPRITVGWVNCDGLGVRARYWEFDHCAAPIGPDPVLPPIDDDVPASLCVDTYNLDLEVFDTFCLNCNWDLELSAGVRYNHFVETMVDNDGAALPELRRNLFHGYGGIIAAEARRAIGCTGVLWARARASILMDDKFVRNEAAGQNGNGIRLTDTVAGQTELAFGYDYVMPLCDGSYYFVRASAEWQQWSNFSSSFDTINDENNFDGQSDVGFGGFGLGVGWVR